MNGKALSLGVQGHTKEINTLVNSKIIIITDKAPTLLLTETLTLVPLLIIQILIIQKNLRNGYDPKDLSSSNNGYGLI